MHLCKETAYNWDNMCLSFIFSENIKANKLNLGNDILL
jgi:hypothetical protein